jgi:hypothetical protein
MTGLLPDPLGSHAVLVGGTEYRMMEDLPAVRNNLFSLYDALRSEQIWGLPAPNCTVVDDAETVAEMLDPLVEAAYNTSDTLLFYYAGHGLISSQRGELHLTLRSSNPQRIYTAVPYENVRDILLESRARCRIVILDCCYSGRALGQMANQVSAVVDEVSAEGTYVITAVAENKLALSPPGERFTTFTGELLTIIRNGINGYGPMLDLDSIYLELVHVLKRKGLPLPQKRDRNTAGKLTLIRNQARRADQKQRKDSRRPISGWSADPSAAEQKGPPRPSRMTEHDQLKRDTARALLPLGGSHLIGVIGCTHRAGQTTTCLTLAILLARLRGERIAALDLNQGHNSLAESALHLPVVAIDSILTDHETSAIGPPEGIRDSAICLPDLIKRESAVRMTNAFGKAFAKQPAAENSLREIFERLASRYAITLVDACESTIPGVLKIADLIVLVTPASVDAADALATTQEWLDAHNYGALRDESIIVMNGVSRPTISYVEHAEAIARGRCRAIVRLPWDDHLRGTKGPDWYELQYPPTRVAYTALAGVVVAALSAGRRGVQDKEQRLTRPDGSLGSTLRS